MGGKLAAEAPAKEEVGVEGDAEEIGGNESELSGTQTDDADDGAIHGGDDPALPKLLAEQNSAKDREHAREIVEPDRVQKIQHTGTKSFLSRIGRHLASTGCV